MNVTQENCYCHLVLCSLPPSELFMIMALLGYPQATLKCNVYFCFVNDVTIAHNGLTRC